MEYKEAVEYLEKNCEGFDLWGIDIEYIVNELKPKEEAAC